MSDEFSKIRDIASIIGQSTKRVLVGIGDDAAVLSPIQGKILFCSDAMVEGVHFDLSFATPFEIGHKALAACLSDLAAMNGQPLHVVLSMALPKAHSKVSPEAFLKDFYKGATQLTRRLNIDIVGGDLTSSPGPIFIDVACLGSTENPILRSQVKPGDIIAVSGYPGLSAAGLKALQLGRANETLRRAHLQPEPRFDLLSELNKNNVCRAMIDISDGISSELHHLAKESGVGIEIEADKIPLHADAISLANDLKVDPLNWALSGGEDYELLVALDSTTLKELAHLPKGFTAIGRAVPSAEGVSLVTKDGSRRPLTASGYNHFGMNQP